MYTIGFGKGSIEFEVAEKNLLTVLYPNPVKNDLTEIDEVRRAMRQPIGTPRLSDIVKPNEKIVIITSDITRPMPSKKVLPIVIEELKSAGIVEENIEIILAIGSHRHHTDDERKYLVGEDIYNSNIIVIDSDTEQCVNLGICDNGTPVDIFKDVVDADRVICLGNIEYHYFAGYSGGIKAIMPGVSSHSAIQENHSNMCNPEARAGNLDTNPVRMDIEQTGDFIKVDFILNVILDEEKHIIKAVAGHYQEAHREGCNFLDHLYGVKIKETADIVVVTPGGYPKDINLYQAQKALDNAKYAVKDGGIIIWVASAKEGFGSKVFEEFMRNMTPPQMISEIKRDFRLGGHKAAAIAMVLERARIFFVSDLDDELVRSIKLEPFETAQKAINEALNILGEDSKIIIMPVGGSTLPILECC